MAGHEEIKRSLPLQLKKSQKRYTRVGCACLTISTCTRDRCTAWFPSIIPPGHLCCFCSAVELNSSTCKFQGNFKCQKTKTSITLIDIEWFSELFFSLSLPLLQRITVICFDLKYLPLALAIACLSWQNITVARCAQALASANAAVVISLRLPWERVS